MKISFRVRLIMLKQQLFNFFRKIHYRKIYKARLLKKELKNLVSNIIPFQIPYALNEKGFYPLDKNQYQPSIKDYCEKAVELATVQFGVNNRFELSIYDNVPGYENTLIILYSWCYKVKNKILHIELLGTYIDKLSSYETREEKIKSILSKFAVELG